MVDDYSDYKALFAKGIRELGCWAHARRKFFELHAAGGNPVAAEALARMAHLCAIEDQTAEQRAQRRAECSQPELQSLYDWLLALRPAVANGGGLVKAIDYRRPANRIDNNPIENAI